MQKISPFARAAATALFPVFVLSGCGAWQSVANGTANAFHAVFYKHVENVDVDVSARDALNPDDAGRATSVVVRIYQLKDRKLFDTASYEDLLKQDRKVLGTGTETSMSGVVNPGAALTFSQPIQDDMKYVAVAAFFRQPENPDSWKFVVPVKKLDADAPLRLRLGDRKIDQVNGDDLAAKS
ncbi:type VI secretion system lipoprotein TssJ [Pandoraea apista]|uniref:type VI secretion system lipoprotein TssJ n=1 Tax=Pandoraea apista TaxID=93218 RepID=UPI000F662355|nr:type VI secretion system lipoprotein TssJ [Pandoraea apista]RRW88790.1 type VI secretion system lipoprotein TssJ [Pandoraea apista]RRW98049.1 type VI secretion system lipoprotein TssJ [Pandoraea apista]